MIYSRTITIPANTTIELPLVSQIDVVEGVLKKIWVRWRWGPGNLCGAQIFRASAQLWPTTAREWFGSSEHETVITEAYMLDDEPLQFMVHSYNLDNTFKHSLWIGFEVLRPEYSAGVLEFLEFLAQGGGV